MGYYADLIKQKQEKRNFRADPLGFGPTVVGVGTPDDYKAKFKVGDKVKFYSGEGVIVKGPIKMRFSLTPTYHIKVTTGKEAGREVSRYEEELKKNSKEEKQNDEVVKKGNFKEGDYKIVKKKDPYGDYYWVEHHHTAGKYKGNTYRSQIFDSIQECEGFVSRNLNNSKEEKENESTVEKFDHYGSKIEIIKTDSGNFRYRVSKKGKFKESMSVSTRSEAMRDAIKDAETWANEKEEKDNASVQDRFRHKGCMITILKKGENQYTFTIEQDGREEGQTSTWATESEAVSKAKKEVETVWNSKGEDMNYYKKLAEEKKNGDMDKGGKIYWDCINAHKKLGRAYGNLFNAVGGVEEIINYGVDPETNFSPELARKLESWTRIVENCERQLRTIR